MFNVKSEGNMAKKVLVVDDEKLIVREFVLAWNRTAWKLIVLMMVRKLFHLHPPINMMSYY